MKKAIIFDLNGVFIHSPKLSERFEKDFNVSKEKFLPALSNIMDQVRKPDAGKAFDYWTPVFKEWGITMSEEQFWEYWFGAESPSEEMIALARELKAKGVLVITLSNNFKERANYYGHYPWMSEVVTRAYFSWQTGMVKPAIGAWELVLIDHGLKPEDCLYFDDQQKNLDAATSLGIESVMFTSPQDARVTIDRWLQK